MPPTPRLSSKAISTVVEDRRDPTLPIILEFQMPSTAITSAQVPRSARGILWIIASMLAAILLAMGLIPIDRVVTAPGRVVSRSPTLVLQALEAAIVRSIDVHEGQTVQAGQVLAQLDPTFAAADMGALAAQVSSLQAQVTRLRAEAEAQPFVYAGIDPNLALQAAIFGQRQAEYTFKLENYTQKINGIVSGIAKANSDSAGFNGRLEVATSVEKMRKDLERLQVGSKLNTLAATDNRVEMERNLRSANETAGSGARDLAALIAERNGYVQSWHADISEKLSDAMGKLSDARESLNKAQLRKQLVELRADRDATVLTVAKLSVGSVLQSGQQFITLVPTDAPLEVEANILGRDNGFISVGDPVSVKFDTFPFIQYGLAYGTVRTISADSFTSQDDQRNPTGMVPVPSNSGESYYRARITIDKVDLRATPPDFHVSPGMPVTADIKVGKRTVLQYLLGRVLPVASEGMREP
jgi:membrane fusion protein, hemolysin D